MSLSTFFHTITAWFHSDEAKHAFDEVSRIVPIAFPIVKAIAEMTPTRTDDEIVSVFEHYGIPLAQELHADSGTALLHLATSVLVDRVPASTSKTILQAAIQNALVGYKADPTMTPVLPPAPVV